MLKELYVRLFKSLLFIGLLFLSAEQALSANSSIADFEEDPDAVPDTGIDWPEIEFKAPENRGSGFVSGEVFKFRAQWGFFSRAGDLQITTELLEGKRLMIKSVTNSKGFIRTLYPLTLESETILDAENWRMISNIVNGQTRGEDTITTSFFDYEKGTMVHQDKARPHRDGEKEIPYPVVLDYSAALLQMRGWELEVGKHHPLVIGSKGKFYYVDLLVTKTERVRGPNGWVDAFVLQPVKAVPESKVFREGGSMQVWISNDKDRLPLKLEVKTGFGKATIKLESVTLNSTAKPEAKLASATSPVPVQ